jgi:hypothetical protein
VDCPTPLIIVTPKAEQGLVCYEGKKRKFHRIHNDIGTNVFNSGMLIELNVKSG